MSFRLRADGYGAQVYHVVGGLSKRMQVYRGQKLLQDHECGGH